MSKTSARLPNAQEFSGYEQQYNPQAHLYQPQYSELYDSQSGPPRTGMPHPIEHNTYQQQQIPAQHQHPIQHEDQYTITHPNVLPPSQQLPIPSEAPPPYSPQTPRTRLLPIVIPQITSPFGSPLMSPFIRAYPPALSSSSAQSISSQRFLQFLDGFNASFVANPALQATSSAGMLMSQFYGLHIVQLTGSALQLASSLGSAALSITRAKLYMKAANEQLWHPRGLHAQVLTTKKLLARIGYPGEKLSLLPVERSQGDGSGHQGEGKLGEQGPEATVPAHGALKRRNEALAGYVEPLTFEGAASEGSENLLKRMGEWQAKKLAAKQQKKLDKGRREDAKESEKKGREAEKEGRKMEKGLEKLDREMEKKRREADGDIAKEQRKGKVDKIEKIEREFQEEAGKIEKEKQKVMREGGKEVEKKRREGDKEAGKTERKEEKTVNKIRWIVITDWDERTAGKEVEDDESVEEEQH